MDSYFEAAVMDNRESRENAAQDIKQKFQILTAIVAAASIPLHGGAGFAALGVAGGASLTSAKLQYDALGSGMITADQAREIMVTAGI